MAETTFIYVLTDPRDSSLRYVGKSNNPINRLRAHMRLGQRNTRFRDWLSGLKDEGKDPEMFCFEVAHKQWKFWEIYTIAALRALGHDLLNSSIGGAGAPSTAKSAVHRERIGKAHQKLWEDPEYRAKHEKRIKASGPKVSAALKTAHVENPTYGQRISSGLKRAHVQDPQLSQRIGESLRGAFEKDPTLTEKWAAAAKKVWAGRSDAEKRRIMRPSQKTRGKKSNHTRYHTNRNTVSPECKFCTEETL